MLSQMGSLISKMKVKREKRELIIKMHFTYFIDDPFFFLPLSLKHAESTTVSISVFYCS